MAEPLPEADLDTAVDPDRIARQDFEIERRGFDQRQVRAYLIAVAESLRDAQAREADMRTRMGRAVRRAESAEETAREMQAPAVESDVARQIGDEVAGVLDAARVAGEQRVAAAESSAQQILSNAKNEASELRGAAETVLAERSADAETAAAAIVSEGEHQAEEIRDQARHDHERARRHAMAMVGKARSESDSLIHEAEQARAQILEDMDRRRREARAQVERLRVGRDRLLRSYEVVRRSLDEATTELKISLTEAKVRGDSAARRVAGEPPTPRAQLEAEVADAKMTGLIRIDEQVAHQPSSEPELPAADARDNAPAPEAAPEVPNIDLRTRNQNSSTFVERVAPSPSRPRVGAIETTDPAIRVVPKPPVVAPIIRREEPAVVAEVELDAEVAADVAVDLTDSQAPEIEVAEVTALLVEAGIDSDDGAEHAEDADVQVVEDADVQVAQDEADQPEAVESAPQEVEAVEEVEEVAPALQVVATEDDVAVEPTDQTAEDEPAEPVDIEVSEDAVDNDADTELSAEELDAVFAAELPRGELAVITPDDEIEAVTPLPEVEAEAVPEAVLEAEAEAEAEAEPVADTEAPAGGLFAALRQQRSKQAVITTPDSDHSAGDVTQTDVEGELVAASAAASVPDSEPGAETPDKTPPIFDFDIEEVYRQRDAVVAESANQLERRLKRALADEQNELLAGVRASKKKSVELISLVGDSDEHLSRYVMAIAEVATTAYSAGMALVQSDVTSTATLPAGAVEELIASSIIDPIRRRLEVAGNDEPETQLSTVRAFYRQRKTDDLPVVAADLASLLCTAGLCETLPPGTPLPR